MKWANSITELLGVQYPFVQAPMLGVTTPQMVAAATAAGALGSLSLGDLPASKCIELIRATRNLTNAPFAANIFVYDIPAVSEELKTEYTATKQFLEELAIRYNLEVELPALEELQLTDYREQVEALITEKCKIVSFTFGVLDAASIQQLKQLGSLLIGTCTSVVEAKILERAGVDMICVQGLEAGGHRGSFGEGVIPAIGGLSLLPQVYESVKLPLIYAGGLYNAATVTAARILGAQAFQVGSILLGTTESALLPFEKARLQQATVQDIVLTRSFSGRYARGIRNAFIEIVEKSGYMLPYPYQNKLTAGLRAAARVQNNSELVNIWAGQSVNRGGGVSTAAVIQQLIANTEKYCYEI